MTTIFLSPHPSPVPLHSHNIVQDPSAARSYLFSDGQNMHNRVVFACTVNVHIPATLRRRPILRYQVRKNCTHFTYSLRTESCVSCWEHCKQFEMNTARKQKTQPYLQSETSFLSIIFRGLFNIFCKLPDRVCTH